MLSEQNYNSSISLGSVFLGADFVPKGQKSGTEEFRTKMELYRVCLLSEQNYNSSISLGSVFLGADFVPKGFSALKVFPHSVCCVL